VSPRHLLVANPSFDVYGADLQMLESVRAFVAAGWSVTVLSPAEGPGRVRLEDAGAATRLVDYPVLKRADASPGGIARLGLRAARSLPRLRRVVRESGADLVYVNTVTVPWWLAAARSTRTPALCHVHEAEPDVRPAVRRGLTAPLLLADAVVFNSRSAMATTCETIPRLRSRAHQVYNGVRGPEQPPARRDLGRHPLSLVTIGRISALKATLDALEVAALLVARGHDVSLEVCGSAVPGRDDYLSLVQRRAAEPDLAGRVRLSGYQSPVWPALERNDVFLATSTSETLGNAVVESQLALRPVVATAVGGHLETVLDEQTGLLTPVGDPAAMADQVERLVADPALARDLAERARSRALTEFSPERYAAAIVAVAEGLRGR
jgi:glycosyltransferase involved in cell wall biosynthesis